MHGQQSGDQFQTLNDQLLTYSFSQNIPPSSHSPSQKPKKKIQQKLTLNIIQPSSPTVDNLLLNHDKFHKRSLYTNDGKIVKIGDAIFKSNFQCGNLGEVEQIKGSNTYKITMEKQINSNRTSSWFYFRCQGLKGEINFIVSGFTKTSSLYNEGMRICFRQIKKDDNHQRQTHQNNHLQGHHGHFSEWQRGGSKISYIPYHNNQTDQTVYQLKFSYYFTKNPQTYDYPIVQFAYCYPYGYKRVNHLVKHIQKKTGVVYQSLGKTYEGRDIPMLTIGNQNASRSIVISARVHPGQTVSSFMMEGFLKELTSESQFAQSLKEKYLFKIVPMINPDGVVRGNYRFSAAGYDLNRRWKHCYQSSHPQVFYLKNMIKKLHREKRVLMFIDLHGHSRRKNAFFYGCCSSQKQNGSLAVESFENEEEGLTKAKQFPFLMQKLNSNFKYDNCSFNISKDKEGTARITMWKELHIDYIYTLESSFCGNVDGISNYTEKDFMGMGKSLLEGISIYFYEKPTQSARQSTMAASNQSSAKERQKTDKKGSVFDKFLNIREQAKEELKNSPYLLNVGTNPESGSDSQPEAGIIPQEERQIKPNILTLNVKTDKQERLKTPELFTRSKSPNFLTKNNKSIKFSVRQTRHKNRLTPQQLKNIVDQKLQDLQSEELQQTTFQKRIIAKTINNFYTYNSQQLNDLTADALIKKNERVHSKNMPRSTLQKLKRQRINSENQTANFIDFENQLQNQQENEKRRIQTMARNLLKTRQGAQYRRVKKIAEELKKKNNSFHGESFDDVPIPMVRGIVTVTNELNISKKRIKSIAPSFFPQSQQKNKRFSVETAYRNNSYRVSRNVMEIGSRKLFINGDDISVHCKGTKICI